MFLEITSASAGTTPQKHRQLVTQAEVLLSDAQRYHRSSKSGGPTTTPQITTAETVTALQLQIELERTLHIESKLRWALSDTQFLITTLMQIINALRSVIQEFDTSRLQGMHNATESATAQRAEAVTQKATAESQLAIANERRMLLENLWDQANSAINRLSAHSDVINVPSLPQGPAFPQQSLVRNDPSVQSALTDITNALGKAQELNINGERQAREWQRELSKFNNLESSDELLVLLACTRLADSDTRRTALSALVRSWPEKLETRDALVRMIDDEDRQIREISVKSLIELWPGDQGSLPAIIRAAKNGSPIVQGIAISGLARAWQGNSTVRDALADLTRHKSNFTRDIAAQALGSGWAGDSVARAALLRLARDEHTWATALEFLRNGWPGDIDLRNTLMALISSFNPDVRKASVEILGTDWPGDKDIKEALLVLMHDPVATVRWATEQKLTEQGISGLQGSTARYVQARPGPALVAARTLQILTNEHALAVAKHLHRGVSFDAPVTAIVGENGTGKTILLESVAMRLGIFPANRIRGFGALEPDIRSQIAQNVEFLWRRKPEPGECLHVRLAFTLTNQTDLIKRIQDWAVKYRMVLVDDFNLPRKIESAIHLYEAAKQAATQSDCQFLVSTLHTHNFIPDGMNVIHLRKFRRRLHV